MPIDPPIPGLPFAQWLLPDEQATEHLAQAIAGQRQWLDDFCICLHGDLGTGKTTFVRALLRALGVQGRIKSPTYALMEPYELPDLQVYHFDLYRLDDPLEWEQSGLGEIVAGSGLKLVEWPQKAGDALLRSDLNISLQVSDSNENPSQRRVHLHVGTSAGQRMADHVQKILS